MPKTKSRTVSLFTNGKSQALRIPKEFEFDAQKATITRSKNGILTIAPVKEKTFSELIDEWAKEDIDPAELTMPEIDDLPPESLDHLFD